MSFRVQYGNERYVVCDDEAQRSKSLATSRSDQRFWARAKSASKGKAFARNGWAPAPAPKILIRKNGDFTFSLFTLHSSLFTGLYTFI